MFTVLNYIYIYAVRRQFYPKQPKIKAIHQNQTVFIVYNAFSKVMKAVWFENKLKLRCFL